MMTTPTAQEIVEIIQRKVREAIHGTDAIVTAAELEIVLGKETDQLLCAGVTVNGKTPPTMHNGVLLAIHVIVDIDTPRLVAVRIKRKRS